MGILSEAKAMAALTGKPLQECKRARKVHDVKIRELLTKHPDENPVEVACYACFGEMETIVSSATQPVAPQVQDPEPEPQVRDSEPEPQVTPEPKPEPEPKVDLEATDVLTPAIFEDTADEAMDAAVTDSPEPEVAPEPDTTPEPKPEASKAAKKKTKKKRSRRS